jgi:phage/plasmid primase-like uncharacterized protein
MTIDSLDAERQFAEHLREHGLQAQRIIGDGHRHRCDVSRKGDRGVDDGSYVLHLHADFAHGGCVNWTAADQSFQKWSYRRRGWEPTPEQRREIAREVERARNEYEAERRKKWGEARAKAKNMWKDAVKATASHPYAQRKQIKPEGLRTIRFKDGSEPPLLVPMYNAERQLVNLQFIHADGRKHGLKGGRQADTHFWLARPDEVDSRTICIGEGWATMQTVYHATEHAILCAFNSTNLQSVAEWVRQQCPEHDLVIAADDDWKTVGNPGMTKAREAARAVSGKVAVPLFGEQRDDQWTDFNDMLTSAATRDEGLDAVNDAINNAVPPDEIEHEPAPADKYEDDDEDDDPESKKQADLLVRLARSARLFHNSEGTAYADIDVDRHRETLPIKSEAFRNWLLRQFYQKTKSAPGTTAMTSALAVIAAKAQFEGEEREVFLRVAGHGDKIYLDLCDKEWRAVEIDGDGWRVVSNPPVRFQRRKGMLALPVPEAGGSIEALRDYINIKGEDEDDFVLLVSWLLAALRPRGPYPIFSVTGEAGSAKSTLLKILRSLIDPNVSDLRTPPRTDHDFFIAATSAHVLAYDNLSFLYNWFSDALCRIATGGGFGTRKYYTDDEERLFNAMRPAMLGAIDDVVAKNDLAERAVQLLLTPITGEKRRSDDDLWQEFERDRPGILGALLDAVAHGLRCLPQTRDKLKQQELPRMADYLVWATACGDGLLWDEGEFARAYADNRSRVNEAVVEGDSLTAAVRRLMEVDAGRWSGTMTELLRRLDGISGDSESRRNRQWPSSASALGKRMRSMASPLRRIGIEIDWDREGSSRERVYRIVDVEREAEQETLFQQRRERPQRRENRSLHSPVRPVRPVRAVRDDD